MYARREDFDESLRACALLPEPSLLGNAIDHLYENHLGSLNTKFVCCDKMTTRTRWYIPFYAVTSVPILRRHLPNRSRGYKTCFMLNSTEHELSTAHKKLKYRHMKKFLALSLSDFVFIMLINVKSISRINFVLS